MQQISEFGQLVSKEYLIKGFVLDDELLEGILEIRLYMWGVYGISVILNGMRLMIMLFFG